MTVHTFTQPHPQLVAANARVAAMKAEQKFRKDWVANMVEDCGYRFVDFGSGFLVRPMTVCYIIQKKDVLHVSTAIMHPTDHYQPAEGRFQAATAMKHGHWITLRKPSDCTAKQYLIGVFGNANVISEALMS